ncbi:hypothetical protein [Shewanella glacialipiscicola]|uniref:hypothetical protein n=1 Tax=Shewanella glacialipiscicola TaxID=614069 RepID=UPI003D797C97
MTTGVTDNKPLGKGLNDILNEVQNEVDASEKTTLKSSKDAPEPEAALNVNISAKTIKSLRMIAVHNETNMKDIVNDVLTKWAKRERKKMISELSDD